MFGRKRFNQCCAGMNVSYHMPGPGPRELSAWFSSSSHKNGLSRMHGSSPATFRTRTRVDIKGRKHICTVAKKPVHNIYDSAKQLHVVFVAIEGIVGPLM